MIQIFYEITKKFLLKREKPFIAEDDERVLKEEEFSEGKYFIKEVSSDDEKRRGLASKVKKRSYFTHKQKKKIRR